MARWQKIVLATLAALPLQAFASTYTCVSFEYPPLIRANGDGSPMGLAVDIVDHVFRRLGHTLRVRLYPWARSLAMAKQGEADCIFTLYRTPEREQFLDYSNESLVLQVIYLYARKDSPVFFNGDFSALSGFNVGTAHKVNYGPKFEQARPYLSIDEAPTIEQNFRKLALGRVDIVPSNLYTASSTLTLPSLRERADRIVRLPTPVEAVSSHIAFPKSKNLEALRDSFDAEMRKFAASPEYRRVLSRYHADSAAEPQRVTQAR